jgi:GT2 family glycosyltransferase
MNPRITVVVLTHNRREEVLQTVAQLHSLPERPEVIVRNARYAASSNQNRSGSARSYG